MTRRGNLGIILAPYGQIPGAYPSEIARTTHGGQMLCPLDPQYNTRGETGFYYDTQLGGARSHVPIGRTLADIPNDFEISRTRGILTPNAGWIATQAGPYNQPWVPPNGWTPTGATGVKIGFGDAAPLDPVTAVVDALNKHHQKMFLISAISTAAVVVTSVVAAIRTIRLMKQESQRGG